MRSRIGLLVFIVALPAIVAASCNPAPASGELCVHRDAIAPQPALRLVARRLGQPAVPGPLRPGAAGRVRGGARRRLRARRRVRQRGQGQPAGEQGRSLRPGGVGVREPQLPARRRPGRRPDERHVSRGRAGRRRAASSTWSRHAGQYRPRPEEGHAARPLVRREPRRARVDRRVAPRGCRALAA